MRGDSLSALTDLGFTALEAEIYLFLVRESPATGYRVAQALGKAAANVYKSIESLERKGALLIDDGDARVCRPVPIQELLARLERRFQRRKRRAARAVDAVSDSDGDDRIYRLATRDQVLERARGMIDRATSVVIADVFPEVFPEIRESLQAAAARGVDVAVQLYAEGHVEGAEVVVHDHADRVLEGWPGEQLNLVSDATACLLALLARGGDGVLQAIWSESNYISCLMHALHASDLLVERLTAALRAGEDASALLESIDERRRLISLDNPGYRALLARHGAAMPKNEETLR